MKHLCVSQYQSTDDITEFESMTLLSSECYKIDIRLAVTEGVPRMTKTIINTGAGPNLIKENVLKPATHSYMTSFKTSL